MENKSLVECSENTGAVIFNIISSLKRHTKSEWYRIMSMWQLGLVCGACMKQPGRFLQSEQLWFTSMQLFPVFLCTSTVPLSLFLQELPELKGSLTYSLVSLLVSFSNWLQAKLPSNNQTWSEYIILWLIDLTMPLSASHHWEISPPRVDSGSTTC